MSEQIYESDEYCGKCFGVENLGRWKKCESDNYYFTFCQDCMSDGDSFTKWLAIELDKSLRSQPDKWEEIAPGKWRVRGK